MPEISDIFKKGKINVVQVIYATGIGTLILKEEKISVNYERINLKSLFWVLQVNLPQTR